MNYDVAPIIVQTDKNTLEQHCLDTTHKSFLEYAQTDDQEYTALHANGFKQ
jgi:hypothetical protein